MKALVIFVLFIAATAAHAESWRIYAGGFGSRWNTLGHHGHDQPLCAPPRQEPRPGVILDGTPDCDADDFSRANLDDSIGFRAGVERELWRLGALRVIGGADASTSRTEYNLSQRDFSLFSAAAFAGAEVDLYGVRLGARHGRGGYATTHARRGWLRFDELSATVSLWPGAAVRVSRRESTLEAMPHHRPLRELAVSLVGTGAAAGERRWELLAATGVTLPGAGLGGDRKLGPGAVNRMSVLSAPWRRDLQLELSWTSSGHESSVPSVFRGYDGNFRSKTIEGYGVALARTFPLTRRLSARVAGGLEVADWRDEHRLLTRNGEELVAGLEVAAVARVALRAQLRPRLAIESNVDKIYWRSIDMSEVRCTAGIVLTR